MVRSSFALTLLTAAAAATLAAAQQPAPTVRLSGLVEAEKSAAIVVPRLSGRDFGQMTLMKLVPGGTSVAAGQPLIELDPQDQLREAFNRRLEVNDLNGQIDRTRATHDVQRSQDDTAIVQAQNDVERAKLEVAKNELIPAVDAEKNNLLLEQAEARLKLLRETYDLKRTAARADLRILEIRRDRAQLALENSARNAELMIVRAPFAGLAVLKTTFRAGTMTEFQEGDLVRAGMPVLDVIDPGRMRVRARVNQADIAHVAPGQRAKVRLDAYPGLEFDGEVQQIAPLAVPSQRNPKVRTFTAVVTIKGSHPNLLPDLTASVELLPMPRGGR
ncbi:MAG TPA: HlyD family efflux transporter periplasmic adaptor subunit [Vicinamibacterales bacterium]